MQPSRLETKSPTLGRLPVTSRYALSAFTLLLLGVTVCNVIRADTPDEAAIKRILNDGCAKWIAGRPEASIDLHLMDIVVYDVAPPRQKNYDQMVKFNVELSKLTVGTPTCVYEEIHPVILIKVYAYSTSILKAGGKLKDGKSYQFRERSTDIWKKVGGQWRVMHEHNSVPVDVITGVADMEAKP
jgi:ketosteroid isomerase-like protein